MHTGDSGDVEALGLQAEPPTGQAIASGAKGRSSNKYVWLQGAPVDPHLLNHGVLVRGKIAITTDECGHHLPLPSSGAGQGLAQLLQLGIAPYKARQTTRHRRQARAHRPGAQ